MSQTKKKNFINLDKLKSKSVEFKKSTPFNHFVVDDFLNLKLAYEIENEFLDFNSSKWYCYQNKIEDKKALNDWNSFPPQTYLLFRYLISNNFVDFLSELTGIKLYPDPGLHGGGWHIHGKGGNLNPHLDYSIHPKLGLQRKINIIIYISQDFKEEYGGHLGFWNYDLFHNQPSDLVKEIPPLFNRAVIFDTTQNSWHGMSKPLEQPEGIYRKSLAIYYLCEPSKDAVSRQRALFAPRENQKNNKEIEELIKLRADVNKSHLVYKKE